MHYKHLLFTITLIAIAVNFTSAYATPFPLVEQIDEVLDSPSHIGNACIQTTTTRPRPRPGERNPMVVDDCPRGFTCVPAIPEDCTLFGTEANGVKKCKGICSGGSVPSLPTQTNGLSVTVLVGAGLIITLLLASYSVMMGKPKK